MQVTLTATPNAGYMTNLAIPAGETVALSVNVAAGGSPVDLTGYTLKMQIAFPTPLALNTGNGGITIKDAANGILQVGIADDVSAGLPLGGYPYDLWMISGGGQATRLLSGRFDVIQTYAVIP